MYKSLDIETQRWADTQDVLAIKFLEDRSFACIVQPS
jgi:hypothetical protein